MDISTLSLAELKSIFAQLPKEIERREKEEKVAARKELEAFAAERGFSLEELIGSADGKKKEKGTVAVKYRHPENPELTWTGRGRQPKWIVAFVEASGTIEQLSV